MMQIIRFNPWFYALGVATVFAGGCTLAMFAGAWPVWVWWAAASSITLATWWLAASLMASHFIYDRSDWPQGDWLSRALGDVTPQRVLNVHTGFDETTDRLQHWLPQADVTRLDVFDASRITERSLLRARTFRPPREGTLTGRFDAWPAECQNHDAVLMLLTAHEFRSPAERRSLLSQACSALHSDKASCIILAEHVRDAANFSAFGPGFLHFHSARTWQHDWESARLTAVRSLRVTPFLRIWTLRRMDLA